MLTRLTVRNFKRLDAVDLTLARSAQFIGPTDSGKTTALQALALWDVGVKRWVARYGVGDRASRRDAGVPIHRRDLLAIPVPSTRLLWHDLHVRDVRREGGKLIARNIRIEILVEGVTDGAAWRCGMEFDYANEALIYCRPLQVVAGDHAERSPVPPAAAQTQIAYLPPISTLDAQETRLDAGAINVRIAEGRTAEVLRNLCFQLVEDPQINDRWKALVAHIETLFGVTLEPPRYLPDRGELEMGYQDPGGARLDLACSGRGLHQVLLMLAYLYTHPGTVLLLDEFDAHLEPLRQRQVFNLLLEVAATQGSQILVASHAQAVLEEAVGRGGVVAFVGRPHRIDSAGQVSQALQRIGFMDYRRAARTGWVLYLETPGDLAILRGFARTLEHPAVPLLEDPFVCYPDGKLQEARSHFAGLREAVPDLQGVALFDASHIREAPLDTGDSLRVATWSRGTLPHYLVFPDVLLSWAGAEQTDEAGGPLLAYAERDRREQAMSASIRDVVPQAARQDSRHPWWRDVDARQFLVQVFAAYDRRLERPGAAGRVDYYALARLVPREAVDAEVLEVLNLLAVVGKVGT